MFAKHAVEFKADACAALCGKTASVSASNWSASFPKDCSHIRLKLELVGGFDSNSDSACKRVSRNSKIQGATIEKF